MRGSDGCLLFLRLLLERRLLGLLVRLLEDLLLERLLGLLLELFVIHHFS